MTFSIIAYDPRSGDVGAAVASKVLAVGARVPFVMADVGAVVSQSWINPDYGEHGLAMLRMGYKPADVLEFLIRHDPKRSIRQVAIVGSDGEVDAFTGPDTVPWAGHAVGPWYSVQGNMLESGAVIQAMQESFSEGEGELAHRLMTALLAGDRAGGDKRGKQSASLLVLRRNGPPVDLRVDDDDEPTEKLARMVNLYFAYEEQRKRPQEPEEVGNQ